MHKELRIWPSIIHAMVLGPILSLLTSPLFAFAVSDLFSWGSGYAHREGLVALLLCPLATTTSAPLAKKWLEGQTRVIGGIIFNGSVLGIFWAVAGLTALSLLGFEGIELWFSAVAFVGIPLGITHAMVFWVSIRIRATKQLSIPNRLLPSPLFQILAAIGTIIGVQVSAALAIDIFASFGIYL